MLLGSAKHTFHEFLLVGVPESPTLSFELGKQINIAYFDKSPISPRESLDHVMHVIRELHALPTCNACNSRWLVLLSLLDYFYTEYADEYADKALDCEKYEK